MMNMLTLRIVSRLSILFILSITTTGVVGADRPVILIFGDSLSAGHGIALSQGWVNLLAQRLTQHGYRHRVINASISGDTSGGGLARLPATLKRHNPAVIILELGGNDGLRGLSLRALEANLATMIELAQQTGTQVLLAEMRIPHNYGPRYTQKFQAIYRNLAERYNVPLVPFLLQGVADNPALMQSDGIHPRAEAQARILDNIWPILKSELTESQRVQDVSTRPATLPGAASTMPCLPAITRSTVCRLRAAA
jgi:acyl-CoA thioesterase-1